MGLGTERAIGEIHRTAIREWYGDGVSKLKPEQVYEKAEHYLDCFMTAVGITPSFPEAAAKAALLGIQDIEFPIHGQTYKFRHITTQKGTDHLKLRIDDEIADIRTYFDDKGVPGAWIRFSNDGGLTFRRDDLYTVDKLQSMLRDYQLLLEMDEG